MGGLDIAAHEGSGKRKGVLRHRKKRIRVAVDMTPFVDIAFLLLIFFMVTTVFRLPQAMELTLPEIDTPPVKVAASNVVTLYVYNDGEMVFRIGNDGPLEPISFTILRETLHDMVRQNDKLITLVKFDRQTPYHWMVDVLDEFLVGKITRYSFDAMTPEEIAAVKGGA